MAVINVYATAIQEAVLKGDLQVMKGVAQQAEDFVKQHGDVAAALELLKLEIAKQEKKPYP